MTIEEMRNAINNHCDKMKDCNKCHMNGSKYCENYYAGDCPEDVLHEWYNLLMSNYSANPYWERITQMSDRQREKGIKTYGQGLELFTTPDAIKRIEYIQEELIDGLMYLEWLKEKLKGEDADAAQKEN